MSDEALKSRLDDVFSRMVEWHLSSVRRAAEQARFHVFYGSSPIEELFGTALMFAKSPFAGYGGAFDCCERIVVRPEYQIGPFRADFALWVGKDDSPNAALDDFKLVIECDGHDFHERTRAQVRRDKQRDRYLVSKGWRVLRFAGSEIWADPIKCAHQALAIVFDHFEWGPVYNEGRPPRGFYEGEDSSAE